MVSQSYIGLLQDPTYAETETSGTTSSQNVQLHPNFGSFAFKYPPTAQTINPPWKDYVIKAADNISFDKFSPLTAPEGLKGVDSYYAPRGTVKVTFYTSGMGTATRFLDNIGTYASTPVYANGPLPTGGNFLLTSVSVSTYGTVYKLSCEWMMSEQGVGWSETLYRKFGSGGSKSQNKYNILGVVGDFNLGTDPSLGIW